MNPETSRQRIEIAAQLRRYGSGWEIDRVEEHFTIDVHETPTEYRLAFTARGASGLRSDKRLGKQDGFSGNELTVPHGPELSADQRALADEILRATRTLWLVQLDGRAAPVDVSGGTLALLGQRTLETRLRDGTAVLYMRTAEETAPIFVAAIDLSRRRVVEARWHELPPNHTRLIPPDEVKFLDDALRRNGDFGVYGDVTAGLASLTIARDVSIEKSDGHYRIRVTPRDGGGHRLAFTIDGKTGAISDVAAGHSMPAPRPSGTN